MGERPKADGPVLDGTSRLFLDELRAAGRSEGTIEAYTYALSAFAKFLQGHGLNEATPGDVYAFLGAQKSVNTRQFRLIALRKFYARLILWGAVSSNPTAGIPLPRSRRRAWTPITEREFQHAYRASGEYDRLMLLILYRTGARIGEVCRLRVEHIKLNRHGGVIEFTVRKGGNPGFAAFGEDLADAFRHWLHTHTGWIFPHSDGRAARNGPADRPILPTTAHMRIIRAGWKVGLHLPPHRLRHSFATLAVEAGWPQLALQQQLGHSSPMSTAIYYHPSRNGLQDLYLRLRPKAQMARLTGGEAR